MSRQPERTDQGSVGPSGPRIGRVSALATQNLGDAIQTWALEQLLPAPAVPVDRRWPAEDCARLGVSRLLVYGWLDLHVDALGELPAEVATAFVAVRAADRAAPALATPAVRAALGRGGPVGCRDAATRDAMAASGVDAWFSGCLTSTLPRRAAPPEHGEVLIVDGAGIPVPTALRAVARTGTHLLPCELADPLQLQLAESVLAYYRERARLVITTRLHCALPCAAMGIPVVCFAPKGDSRYSALEAIGVPVHRLPGRLTRRVLDVPLIGRVVRRWLGRRVDWEPPAAARTEGQDALADHVRQIGLRLSSVAPHPR